MGEREESRGDDTDRRRQQEILNELMRLLRADAEIMETVRDMIRTGSEEATRRPHLLFQAQRAEEVGEGEILGGQGPSPVGAIGSSLSSVFGQLLDLVKSEKEFIRSLILKLLGL